VKAAHRNLLALLSALFILGWFWRAACLSLSEDLPLTAFLSHIAILLPSAAVLGVVANSFVLGKRLREEKEMRFGISAVIGLYLPVPLLLLYGLVLSSVWYGVYESANRGMWLLRMEVMPLYGVAAATFITIDFLLFKFIDLQRAKSAPSWLSALVDANAVVMLLMTAGLYTFVLIAGNVFAFAGGLIVAAGLSLVWALRYAAHLRM